MGGVKESLDTLYSLEIIKNKLEIKKEKKETPNPISDIEVGQMGKTFKTYEYVGE